MAYFWLTPPSRAVFFLSVLLAVLASSALRARRNSRSEQLQLRDIADSVPSPSRRQHVPRLLDGWVGHLAKLDRNALGERLIRSKQRDGRG